MFDFNVTCSQSMAYDLTIVKNGAPVAKFVFTKPSQLSKVKSVAAVDLYCLNTSCQQITSLGAGVRTVQLTEMTSATFKANQLVQSLFQSNYETQLVFVIDAHHDNQLGGQDYTHAQIPSAEENLYQKLSDFPDREEWKRGSKLSRAQHLLMDIAPLAMMFEGSLKHDILENSGLSVEDQRALQSNGTLLCQIAEVFMNAFKFGHQGRSTCNDKMFDRDSYYTSRRDACQKSYVLYSSQYQELYGITSSFVDKMRAVFQVELVEFDPRSCITTLCYLDQEGVCTTS